MELKNWDKASKENIAVAVCNGAVYEPKFKNSNLMDWRSAIRKLNKTLTTYSVFYQNINSRKLHLLKEKSYSCYPYLQMAIKY